MLRRALLLLITTATRCLWGAEKAACRPDWAWRATFILRGGHTAMIWLLCACGRGLY